MLTQTQAIVLSKLKYADHHLIVKCYTSQYGVVTYFLKHALTSKRKQSTLAYFQSLFQLELVTSHKSNQDFHFIKEYKLHQPYQNISTDVVKTTIALFLAEVLSNSLKEETPNPTLYNYLTTTLQWLDTHDNCANFHLLFLLNLTKHLGFYPDTSNGNFPFFNLEEGQFQQQKIGQYSVSNDNLTVLKTLLGTTFEALHTVKLNTTQRQSFLKMILQYFELHLSSFKTPKSLDVFNQVFN